LGGHFDSINQSWMGGQKAPGADDNASGSANLAEIARLIAQAPRLQRDVEIYWYAGEEGGLLGSAEIAKAAQSARKSVRGVLQLDMTLQPGSGRFKIGSMTDFTDANLREDLKRINTLYVGAEIIDDQCGYGCSDHASWHRHGFPAIMPTEAKKRDMNKNIHTERDVLSASSDLTHSAMFAKLGLAFALDLSGLASPSGIAQP
jgi:leucyl aminopeptidase